MRDNSRNYELLQAFNFIEEILNTLHFELANNFHGSGFFGDFVHTGIHFAVRSFADRFLDDIVAIVYVFVFSYKHLPVQSYFPKLFFHMFRIDTIALLTLFY